MKKQIKDKKESTNNGLGVVAGVAALSAAAYVLFGPNAKKNRKVIRGWAVKMKGEIIEKFEDVKVVTEPAYHRIIDQISKKYSKNKNIDQKELKSAVTELKKHWKTMTKK